MSTLSVSRVTRVVAITLIVLSGTLLASCGSSLPGRTSGLKDLPSWIPLHATFCDLWPTTDRLTVQRVVEPSASGRHFATPATHHDAHALLVQLLATTICSLPTAPSLQPSCPADVGVTYRLTFIGPNGSWAVPIEASGCQDVGVTPTRTADRSPGLFKILGAVLGLRHATRARLLGSLHP